MTRSIPATQSPDSVLICSVGGASVLASRARQEPRPTKLGHDQPSRPFGTHTVAPRGNFRQRLIARWKSGVAGRIFRYGLLAFLLQQPFQSSAQSNYTFTTFAGVGGIGSVDGTGRDARFNFPHGVARDTFGNLYISDFSNHTIRKITPTGVVTTLAGMPGVYGTNNGVGSDARFTSPWGLAVDSSGMVYVADYGNHTIRKITPAGVVTTLAGLPGVAGTNNGTGSAARFSMPNGVAVDGSGNIYVGDEGNHLIRKITSAGTVSTFAGTVGVSGTNNGTPGRFNGPRGVAFDTAGNLYVADGHNNTIRKITTGGTVSTLAGLPGTAGTNNGTGTAARFNRPSGVTVDSLGNVYVTDTFNNTIRRVTSAGGVTTWAGQPNPSGGYADGPGTAALFDFPYGIVVDGPGNLYVADSFNYTVRKISPAANVSTFAGAYPHGYADGIGNNASFREPRGVAVDLNGNVWVSDYLNNTVRRISPAGVVTTIAGLAGSTGANDGDGEGARFNNPAGIAVDSSGNAYVADNNNQSIRRVTPAGHVTTLPGVFGFPLGVAVDSSGNVYVADTDNYAVQKIAPGGTISLLAGLSESPNGVAVDPGGNVYASSQDTIFKITPGGSVSVLAGGTTGSADGVGTNAQFDFAFGIAVDQASNVFVAEYFNQTIRKITPAGVVSTPAGLADHNGNVDGTGQTARFNSPQGIAVDASGNVYVADTGNSTIRKGSLTPPNDYFTNRTTIISQPLTVMGFNVAGTKEVSEPNHASNPGGQSVWWTWTAPLDWPTNVAARIDTIGSTFDTLLAVYTNGSVSSLVEIASDDDSGGNLTSKLQFVPRPGGTYQIAVDGYNGASGVIKLNLGIVPSANDDLSKALLITGGDIALDGLLFGASIEQDEPVPDNSDASLWYRWTAPFDGRAVIYCSSPIGAYNGTSIAGLSLFETNNVFSSYFQQYKLVLNVSAGEPFLFQVSGSAYSRAPFNFRLIYSPSNDDEFNPLPLPFSTPINGSNLGATHEFGEDDHGVEDPGQPGIASVWWSFIPSSGGEVELDKSGSTISPIVTVYENGGQLASNFQLYGEPGALAEALYDRIRFPVWPGFSYKVVVDGYAQSEGDYRLLATYTAARTNDAFDSRITIPVSSNYVSGSNIGATVEADEPVHAGTNTSRSVWWKWIPNFTGQMFITTFGSTFDTVLDVYTGSSLPAGLFPQVSNDNAFVFSNPDTNAPSVDILSRVKLLANAGTIYQIAVSGANGSYGNIALNFTQLAIEDLLSVNRTNNADNSVDFGVTLHLTNVRTNLTGPLRIRLLAHAQYSCATYLKSDLDFLDSLNVPDEVLSITNLPGPATLASNTSTDFLVRGQCPPPYVEGVGYHQWGYGRCVYALLEEFVGGQWQTQDARLIVFGAWPNVPKFQGTGGGVITINSMLAGAGSSPAYLQVNIGPLSAMRHGGAWRVSPTNFGELRELRSYTNYMTTARTISVLSTNFTVETLPLTGFKSPPSNSVGIVPGQTTPLNLMYSVVPPTLTMRRSAGVGIAGTADTVYRIESTTKLGPTNSWLAITNINTGLGSNSVPNTLPLTTTNRFYRAVWLPDQ